MDRNRVGFFFFVVVAVFLISSPSFCDAYSKSPWATYRANSQRTGAAVSTGPTKCAILWNQTYPNADFGEPLIGGGGTLFVIDRNTGTLLAIHGNNGGIIWQQTFRAPSHPTIGPLQHLYISSGTVVYALNATTGNLIWKLDVQVGTDVVVTTNSQNSNDTTVYVSAYKALIALNGLNGLYKWITNSGFYSQLGYGTMSSDGSTIYVNDYQYTYGVDTSDGDISITLYLGYSPSIGTLNVPQNLIYYDVSVLEAFNLSSSGSLVFKSILQYTTGPTLSGSYIYFGHNPTDSPSSVNVIDSVTGKAVTAQTFLGDVDNPPTTDNRNNVFVPVADKYIYSLKFSPTTNTFTTNWIFSPSTSIGNFNTPVLDFNGNLFVTTDEGQIYAFSQNATTICLG